MNIIIGLLYIICACTVMTGIYLLYVNNSQSLNRLGFLFCTALACFSFSLAQSVTAADSIDAVCWRRFATIGIVSFYSFFLHYVILLTGHGSLWKKGWFRFLFYVPMALCIYFFALSDKLAAVYYHPVHTQIGWICSRSREYGGSLFDLYGAVCILTGFFLILFWQQKTSSARDKKLSTVILTSYIITFAVFLLADLLDMVTSASYFHQLSPLILIVLISGIIYSIQKYKFMGIAESQEDTLFFNSYRIRIVHYLSIGFFAGGIIYFVTSYYFGPANDIYIRIIFSLLFFILGLCVFFIDKFPIHDDGKITLFSILLSLAVPVITLNFISSAGITVWAFPFIIIIATLMTNNATILTMVSASTIYTQLYLWIKVPSRMIAVDQSDYFGRLLMMGIAIWLICYFHRIFSLRLKQLSEKIKSQDLMCNITSLIISGNQPIEEKMDEVLHKLCVYLNADRAHLSYHIAQDGLKDSNYYFHSDVPDDPAGIIFRDPGITEYEWWKSMEKSDGLIQIKDIFSLPDSFKQAKQYFLSQNMHSMIGMTLVNNNCRIGFLRIDFSSGESKWSDDQIKILMMIGNILGEANIKASSEKKMLQMAYYDQLTNIPNRQLFGQQMTAALMDARRKGHLIGIIFLDMDSFKTVNNSIGHQYGDRVLVMTADILKNCLRKTDTICRFGGDEFLIMLDNIVTQRDIETVAKKIMRQFERPICIGEYEFYITASIGISVFPTDGTDQDTLIKNADIAMYKAKSNGKKQFLFCSRDMKDEMQRTMIVTNYLYHALEKDEISIVYQPQVSVATGKIIAIEALARWENPDLGIISPSVFIPIAEQTGLINAIGEHILTESCRQNREWQEMGFKPIRIAVNVSINQLLSADFITKVSNTLSKTGLDPEFLELEITENIAMRKSDIIIHVLTELKSLGISIAIDDFGMEYSSLNRIKMLPINRLKIDMHFITGILTDGKDRAIVNTIIKLAKDLNVKVIAEGVETEEQFDYLKRRHCDEVQGYYFYKPLSKEDVYAILSDDI